MVRGALRPELDLDVVFGAALPKRLAGEISAVVGMSDSRSSSRRGDGHVQDLPRREVPDTHRVSRRALFDYNESADVARDSQHLGAGRAGPTTNRRQIRQIEWHTSTRMTPRVLRGAMHSR